MGPEGWRKCPSRNINKRFLVSTIRDAVYTNKRVKLNNKNVYYRENGRRKESPTNSVHSPKSQSPPIPSHQGCRSDEEETDHKYIDSLSQKRQGSIESVSRKQSYRSRKKDKA